MAHLQVLASLSGHERSRRALKPCVLAHTSTSSLKKNEISTRTAIILTVSILSNKAMPTENDDDNALEENDEETDEPEEAKPAFVFVYTQRLE